MSDQTSWELSLINTYITKAKKYRQEYDISYGDWNEPYSEELDAVHKKDGIINKPVDDDMIDRVQDRLQMQLPPSYLTFLKYSNGMLLPNRFTNLLPIEKIDWFYTLNKEWVDIWLEGDCDVDDDEYFVYGMEQDSCKIRNYYLKDALQISDSLEGDVLLLNPNVKFDQEWEAWFFSNSFGGAIRFRSFKEMLEYLLSEQEENISQEEYAKVMQQSQEKLNEQVPKLLNGIISGANQKGLNVDDIKKEFQQELEKSFEEFQKMFDNALERHSGKDI